MYFVLGLNIEIEWSLKKNQTKFLSEKTYIQSIKDRIQLSIKEYKDKFQNRKFRNYTVFVQKNSSKSNIFLPPIYQHHLH